MAGLVLDGKAYAKELEAELQARVVQLKEKTGEPIPPPPPMSA
jgi:hypothetical protein